MIATMMIGLASFLRSDASLGAFFGVARWWDTRGAVIRLSLHGSEGGD